MAVFLALLAGVVAGSLLCDILTSGKPVKKEETWLLDYDYAHRGLHGEGCPENSLPAIKRAVLHGYAVEIDVQLSKDGVPVVFHDKNLRRVTGEASNVGDLALAQIKELRLEGTGCSIPTLGEVLKAVRGRAPLLIELKSRGRAGALEPAVYEQLKAYDGHFAVQSFSPLSLRWFKKNAPHVLRGQLSCDFGRAAKEIKGKAARFLLASPMFALQRLKLNILSRPNFISYGIGKINTQFVKKLRNKGLAVLTWTVNSTEQLRQASPFADGVIFEGFLPVREKTAS